jgi:hypothetical protein
MALKDQVARRAYSREYAARNRPQRRENNRRWRELNPEKTRLSNRAYARRRYREDPARAAAAAKLWRDTHPESYAATVAKAKARLASPLGQDWRWRKVFGLTAVQYLAMLAMQNGVCAICHGVNPSGRRLAIDHDHDTKRVRALLCGHCNHRILGHLTVEKARRALAILESDFDGRNL